MPYKGFVGSGTVGHFLTTTDLQTRFPADTYAGRMATVEGPVGTANHYFSDGNSWKAHPLVVTDPLTGEIGLNAGDGQTYELTLSNNPVAFPDEVYSASASGGVSVFAGPCQLVGVRGQTVTAGPLTITIYDSSSGATGTVLYTGSINTGTEASIPSPVIAFQGVFLSFTGTGTFDITLRGI